MRRAELLQDLSDPNLEAIMNLNLAGYWTEFGKHLPDTTTFHDTRIAWISSRINTIYFNIVVPLDLPPDEQDEAIAASIERARAHGVQTMWWLSPVLYETDLTQRLKDQRFADVGGPAGMAIDLANLNENIPRSNQIEIRRVQNEAMLRQCADTFSDGWPLDEHLREPSKQSLIGYGLDADLRHYIAFFDGTPASVASVFFHSGVAGIYAVATLEAFRGKGLGALVTQAPLIEARDRGYKVGILQSSGLGHPVYKRLGFVDTFPYKIFMWPAPKQD